MYPDSVSRVHFLFVLIYGKSGFFIKFVKTYSISIKMGEYICFRRNERLATVNPYWRGNPMALPISIRWCAGAFLTDNTASVRVWAVS